MKSGQSTPVHPKGADAAEKSIADLLRDLYQEFATMVDRQLALAKAEAAGAAEAAGRGVAVIAAGGVVVLVGFIYLMLALVFALSRAMPGWAAALIVGGVLGVAGAIAVRAGVARLRAVGRLLPETRQTLRQDQAWAREEARELKREIGDG